MFGPPVPAPPIPGTGFSVAGAVWSVDPAVIAEAAAAVPTSRTITAGTGLSGGGDLSANRTLSVDATVVALLAGATFAGTVSAPQLSTTGTAPVVVGGNATYAIAINKANALLAFFADDAVTRRGYAGPQGTTLMQLVGDSEIYLQAVPTNGIVHHKVGATDEQTIQGTLQTTDATPTNMRSISPSASTVLAVEARVEGRKSDGSAGSGFWVAATFRIAANGTVTQIGTTTAIASHTEVGGGAAATIDTSGGIIRILVTGVVATTINWRCMVRTMEQPT